MENNPYWFFQKWGIQEPTPFEILEKKIQELENRVRVLEDENVGQTNALYETMNSIETRIDILTAEKFENFNLGGK